MTSLDTITVKTDFFAEETFTNEVIEYIVESNALESRDNDVFDNISLCFLSPDDLENDNWSSAIRELTSKNNSIRSLFTNLSKTIRKYSIPDDLTELLEMTVSTYDLYMDEMKSNERNKYKEPSIESLYQLVRFMPEYPRKKQLNIYLDEMTGAFGVIIKSKEKGNPVLNVLMKDNKEVVFSFIKKNHAIIKISGRAYFNDSLNDSTEINKIFRMI